jgi:hypothetical protein
LTRERACANQRSRERRHGRPIVRPGKGIQKAWNAGARADFWGKRKGDNEMRKTGSFILVLLVLLAIANCKKQENGPAQATKEALGNSSEAVALKQGTTDSEESETASPDEGRPHIAFEQKDFDFGKVEAGEKIEHLFSFRNTGNGTLKIHKVRSS